MNEELDNIRKEINFLENKLNKFLIVKHDIQNGLDNAEKQIRSWLADARLNYSNALTKFDLDFVRQHNDVPKLNHWFDSFKLPEDLYHELRQYKAEVTDNCLFRTDPEACRDCDGKCYKYAIEKFNNKYHHDSK